MDEKLTEKLYDRALHFLGFRPRSEKEMREYLGKKAQRVAAAFYAAQEKGRVKNTQLPEDIVKPILQRLKRAGLLDDHEFTLWWISQRQQSTKPKGKALIAAELFQKGIPREFFESVWQEYQSSQQREEQAELATKLARKKLSTLSPKLNKLQKKKNVSDHLARRGFGWEDIKEALERTRG